MGTRMRHADAQILAMKAAREHGQDELALMILDGTARVYTRTSKSRPGWQVADWDRPVPEGTEIVILVDAFDGPPAFSLMPAEQYRALVAGKKHPRPRSPEARHCIITPDEAAQWLDAWTGQDRQRRAPSSAQ